MQRKDHWERVYADRSAEDVSWYQRHAQQSLRMIHGSGVPKSAAIIDIGGGASTLVDDLLADGFSSLTVLDLSSAALAAARARLGARAASVRWIEADITDAALPAGGYDLWHDRAVFHFLTEAPQRQAYVAAALRAVKPGGHVIVATFAEDGPTRCSGLPIMRYSAEALHAEFGPSLTLISRAREAHRTPTGAVQQFVYCLCRKSVAAAQLTDASRDAAIQ